MFGTAPPQTLQWWVGGFAVEIFDTLATHPIPPASGGVRIATLDVHVSQRIYCCVL